MLDRAQISSIKVIRLGQARTKRRHLISSAKTRNCQRLRHGHFTCDLSNEADLDYTLIQVQSVCMYVGWSIQAFDCRGDVLYTSTSLSSLAFLRTGFCASNNNISIALRFILHSKKCKLTPFSCSISTLEQNRTTKHQENVPTMKSMPGSGRTLDYPQFPSS